MKKNKTVGYGYQIRRVGLALAAALFLLTACGGSGGGGLFGGGNSGLPDRDPSPVVLAPEAPGTDTMGNEKVVIDVSNTADGYFMVQYTGDNPKVKLRVTPPGGDFYDYDLAIGAADAFPLVDGNGTYKIEVYENSYEDKYTQLFSGSTAVAVKDEFTTYLRPDQYVYYDKGSSVVAAGQQLATGAKTDIDVVESVYKNITESFTYDYNKAATVQSGYVPDVDAVWAAKTGICFDYASVMTAMLRSQRIPTRLVIGYVTTEGEADPLYHAWIDVYTTETGWIKKAIQFNGSEWVLMDPTLASTSGLSLDYTGEGNSYSPTLYN